MVTITWTIDSMSASTTDIDGHTEVVLHATWRCAGEQDGYSSFLFSICPFAAPSEGEPFTPYEDLTEEQVLGWIWANGVDKDATEAAVAAQIEAQINPPIVQPALPWAQEGAQA